MKIGKDAPTALEVKEKKNKKVVVPIASYWDGDVELEHLALNLKTVDKNIRKKIKTQKYCTYCNQQFKTNDICNIGYCGCLYHEKCFEKVYKSNEVLIYCNFCNNRSIFNTTPWVNRTIKCRFCEKHIVKNNYKPKCVVTCYGCNSF